MFYKGFVFDLAVRARQVADQNATCDYIGVVSSSGIRAQGRRPQNRRTENHIDIAKFRSYRFPDSGPTVTIYHPSVFICVHLWFPLPFALRLRVSLPRCHHLPANT